MEALAKHPQEARVQRYGYASVAASAALAAYAVATSPGDVFGLAVPAFARYALVAAGAVAALAGVARRSTPIALGGTAALVLGVVPGGVAAPGLVGYALAILLGALLLASNELVSMTQRYDRAHQLVEEEGASEESLDRVTDEALRTLGARLGLATLVVAGGALLALILSAIGPGLMRDAVETASPLGVAVVAGAILAGLSIYILVRGARFGGKGEATQEVAPDVEP